VRITGTGDRWNFSQSCFPACWYLYTTASTAYEALEANFAEGVTFSGSRAQSKMEALLQGDRTTAESIQTAGARSFPANASLERILRQKLQSWQKSSPQLESRGQTFASHFVPQWHPS
jgi:hypothetical protein